MKSKTNKKTEENKPKTKSHKKLGKGYSFEDLIQVDRFVHFDEIYGKVYPTTKGNGIIVEGIHAEVIQGNLYVGVNKEFYIHRDEITLKDFIRALLKISK